MRARLIIAGLLATVATLGTASAADLGRPVYKAPPPPAPFFYNWSGFYVGVNVGGSWGRQDTTFADEEGTAFTNSNHLNGVIGGGQIGWNWQGVGSPWVFGLEADIQGSGQKHSGAFDDTDLLLPGSISFEDKLDWFGTVRGRIGYAIGDQGRWLPYITGGLAYGENKIDGAGTLDGVNVAFSQSKTDVGWTVGGGIEWAFADRWSAKLEYLYMDLGDSQTIDFTPLSSITSHHLRDNIARVGVNLHF